MPRILVVDDDPAIAGMLRDLLTHEGFEVHAVASAEECLERLSSAAHGFELVLLDVMLPGLGGFEALERLRGSAATARLPVVMISTLTESSYRRRARELGARAFVPKPFSTRELIDAVRGAVG